MHKLAIVVALSGCSFAEARVQRPVSADASCSSALPKIDLAVAIAMAVPMLLIRSLNGCGRNCDFDFRQYLTTRVGLPTLAISMLSLGSAAYGWDVNRTCRRERETARSLSPRAARGERHLGPRR
jgi:hypothetical protein